MTLLLHDWTASDLMPTLSPAPRRLMQIVNNRPCWGTIAGPPRTRRQYLALDIVTPLY